MNMGGLESGQAMLVHIEPGGFPLITVYERHRIFMVN